MLSEARDHGMVVRVTCNYCRQVRHYLPQDMQTLLGDAEIDGLRRRLTCEDCGKRDYVEVEAKFVWDEEREHLFVRRLVRVKTIRRPVWREGKL